MNTSLRYSLIIAALAVMIGHARAATIVSNLGETANTGSSFSNNGEWNATSFTTGANPQGYVLNSATVNIQNSLGANAFFASIFSSTSNNPNLPPGSQVANGALSGASVPTTGLNTYTATNLALAPNTTYWLVLGEGPGGGFGGFTWRSTTSDNQTSTDGWTIGDVIRFTYSGGASWGQGGAAGHFSIDADAIPEPATLALLPTVLGALALSRRRSTR